ncbi:MAG: DUF2752 domain-containing protein [Candidatus Lindowbacteria bacterium]|nr:DUF2752 domain-containing protein [Candidatus Lindowbacteria bacterium]
MTSFPCATCGTSRMILALLEGRPIDAFMLNPLVFLSCLGLLTLGLYAALKMVRTGESVKVILSGRSIWFYSALVMTIVLNWIYLIVMGI